MTEETTLEREETPKEMTWLEQANGTITENVETLLQEIKELLALTNKRDIFTSNDIQNRMLDMHNTATKIAPQNSKPPHDQNQ